MRLYLLPLLLKQSEPTLFALLLLLYAEVEHDPWALGCLSLYIFYIGQYLPSNYAA